MKFVNRGFNFKMNFIKRIGTEKHSYLVKVVVQYLLTEHDFDQETKFKVQLRRGYFYSPAHHKTETKPSSILQNKMAKFEPHQLQIPITMYFDTTTKQYQEKKAELRVILIRKETKKKVGNIQFDISQYLNKCMLHNEEKRNLDNCPHKFTFLSYQIFLKEAENLSFGDQKSGIDNQKQNQLKQKFKQKTKDSIEDNYEVSQQKHEKIVNLVKQKQRQSLSQCNQPVKKKLLHFEQEADEIGWNYQNQIIELEMKVKEKEIEIAKVIERENELIQKVTLLENENRIWVQKDKELNKEKTKLKEKNSRERKKQQTRDNVPNGKLLQIQQQKYRQMQLKYDNLQQQFNQMTKEYHKVNKILQEKEIDLSEKEDRLEKLSKNKDANVFDKQYFLKRIEELQQELYMNKKSRAEAVQAALQQGNSDLIQFLQQYIL